VRDCVLEKSHVNRCLRGLVRVDIGLTVASLAVLAAGFAFALADTGAVGSGGTEPQTGSDAKSASAAGQTERTPEPFAASASCATFDERFYFGQQASFGDRFASAFGASENATRENATRKAAAAEPDIDTPPLQLPPDKPLVMRSIPPLATASRNASFRVERPNPAAASIDLRLPLAADSHTAIYDIAARTVYLPGGNKLEAHSGLGGYLDDSRYIRTKMQGPTPPNVYNLSLREQLFHGVRAIRLVPVDDGKMFGRDGILAHSFMLGPNGQSNGCVSFRDYPAFLNAFLKGDVNRLVVVEHLPTAVARTGSANGG
jgi:Protein of unknown function (DUF2778)